MLEIYRKKEFLVKEMIFVKISHRLRRLHADTVLKGLFLKKKNDVCSGLYFELYDRQKHLKYGISKLIKF